MANRMRDHCEGQLDDASPLNPSSTASSSTEYYSCSGAHSWISAPLDGAADTSPTNLAPSISTVSSEYHSTRIESMVSSRSQFSTELEFQIENSRVHWSQLIENTGDATEDTDESSIWDTEEATENDTAMAKVQRGKNTPEGHREYFEELKTHPQWGPFFSEVQEVVVGEKIAEGAQAEIYDAEVTFKDGRKFKDNTDYGIWSEEYCNTEFVVKVLKGDCALQDLQRQWPMGMLLAHSRRRRLSGPLKFLSGGTLLKNAKLNNKFAFVMDRLWGDLRKLIDMRMLHNNNRGPPFHIDQVHWMITDIAMDLKTLHERHGIIHRDIKASNVLIFRDKIEDVVSYTGRFRALVADWECSVGVVGTGFWRAPEILQQLKNKVPSSKLVFTKESDMCSFGMLCYEMVTGCIPFEDQPASDYNVVLNGYRPKLPDNLDPFLEALIRRCWHANPLERPTFCGRLMIIKPKYWMSLPKFLRGSFS